jgi:hypothetical protein
VDDDIGEVKRMAYKQVTVYTDDLTGKELTAGAVETVLFSIDGTQYELDTDAKSAQRLRALFDRYISAGRRSDTARRAPTRRTRVAPSSTAVRIWAAANGIPVNTRGRIPGAVLERYEAAGN